MKVLRVLNNNFVIALDDNDQEVIVMSLGLGFKKKKGDRFSEKMAEKIFVLSSDYRAQYDKLMRSVDPIAGELAEHIITYAQTEKELDLNDVIHISLTDHIDGMLERHSKGLIFENQLKMEIRRAYPTEYAVGLYAIDYIREKTGLDLCQDEAAFIALHFIDNGKNHAVGKESFEEEVHFINDTLKIVEQNLGISLDENSMPYYRFVTHLKYLMKRMITGTVYKDDPTLYETVKKAYPASARCVDKIVTLIVFKYHREVSTEEKAYLIIYVEKLTRG